MKVHYRGITLLLAVVTHAMGSPVPQTQGGKSDQSALSPYDPQLLNYQLQQLALQQYSRAQDQNQQSHELALQEYTRAQDYTRAQEQNQQAQQLALQQYAGQQAQAYDAQAGQYPTVPTQAVQFPTLPTQGQQPSTPSQNDQYLQQKLFQPAYQTQFTNEQLAGQAGQAQQSQAQQSEKQKLLGVAYSSAADASRTSFTGYGIKYSF